MIEALIVVHVDGALALKVPHRIGIDTMYDLKLSTKDAVEITVRKCYEKALVDLKELPLPPNIPSHLPS